MRLKTVQISQFRSIEDMGLSFDGSGHKILVGKNESGKSNILDALNLLSNNIMFEQKDKKQPYNETGCVTFDFELDKHEIEKCRNKFLEKFPAGQHVKLTKDHTVTSFFEEHSKSILYEVPCGQNGFWNFWSLNEDLKL